MIYLVAASLIWALSFSLIKHVLAGLDSNMIAMVRLALSCFIFLPFLKWQRVRASGALRLLLLGAVQYGFMYVFYLAAFRYLAAYEIALFTVMTPFYVVLVHDLYERRIVLRHLLCAAVAVLSGTVLLWRMPAAEQVWRGFALMQLSNICFAAGQVYYRRRIGGDAREGAGVFGWIYAGALLAVLPLSLGSFMAFTPTLRQWGALFYLGVLPSGAAFYFWNIGAVKVGAGALAVMNNLKIPLAVLLAVLFFGERPDLPRLALAVVLLVVALYTVRDEVR